MDFKKFQRYRTVLRVGKFKEKEGRGGVGESLTKVQRICEYKVGVSMESVNSGTIERTKEV